MLFILRKYPLFYNVSNTYSTKYETTIAKNYFHQNFHPLVKLASANLIKLFINSSPLNKICAVSSLAIIIEVLRHKAVKGTDGIWSNGPIGRTLTLSTRPNKRRPAPSNKSSSKLEDCRGMYAETHLGFVLWHRSCVPR